MRDNVVQEVGLSVLNCLEQMDAEAIEAGFSLSEYGSFASPGGRDHEVQWAERLAELISGSNWLVATSENYPGQNRRKCDLVLHLAGERLWIEAKGAWRTYWGGTSNSQHDGYRTVVCQPHWVCGGVEDSRKRVVVRSHL